MSSGVASCSLVRAMSGPRL